jgi:hypothetical protein
MRRICLKQAVRLLQVGRLGAALARSAIDPTTCHRPVDWLLDWQPEQQLTLEIQQIYFC